MSLEGNCLYAFKEARRDVLAAARVFLPHADAGDMGAEEYESLLKKKNQHLHYSMYNAIADLENGRGVPKSALVVFAKDLQAGYNKQFPKILKDAPAITAVSLRAAARCMVASNIAMDLLSNDIAVGEIGERHSAREKFLMIGFHCVDAYAGKNGLLLHSPVSIAATTKLKLKVEFEASNAQVENTYFTLGQNDVKRLIKEILPYSTHKDRTHESEDRETLVRQLFELADKADVDTGLAVNAFIKGDPEHLPIHHRMRGRVAYLAKCRSVLPALCDSDVEPSAQRDRDLEYLRRCFISLTSILQDCDPATDKEPPRLKPLEEAQGPCVQIARGLGLS